MEGNLASAHVNWRVTKIVMLEFCKTFIKESSNFTQPPVHYCIMNTTCLHMKGYILINSKAAISQYILRTKIRLGADEANLRQVCSIV